MPSLSLACYSVRTGSTDCGSTEVASLAKGLLTEQEYQEAEVLAVKLTEKTDKEVIKKLFPKKAVDKFKGVAHEKDDK